MLLDTKNGIVCDLCNRPHKNQFVYYSMRMVKVSVDVDAKQTIHTDTDIDLDVCEFCKKKLEERILEVSKMRGVNNG